MLNVCPCSCSLENIGDLFLLSCVCESLGCDFAMYARCRWLLPCLKSWCTTCSGLEIFADFLYSTWEENRVDLSCWFESRFEIMSADEKEFVKLLTILEIFVILNILKPFFSSFLNFLRKIISFSISLVFQSFLLFSLHLLGYFLQRDLFENAKIFVTLSLLIQLPLFISKNLCICLLFQGITH